MKFACLLACLPACLPACLLACLLALTLSCSFAGAQNGAAQKSIGSVATAEADVVNGAGGTVAISSGRAVLTGNTTVTARTRSAEVSLTRGGKVRICQTSGLHLMQSGDDALLLALDRGALELHMKAGAADTILTPDLRFTPTATGSLDLQLRVARNGDTCVDNRGRNAPSLAVVDAFGQASYVLKPGQHVLFEHGSLREVVDRETTPCGCPEEEKAVPLAEALLHGGQGKVSPKQAAAANPFPAAQSEGLAEPPPREPDAPGVLHTQVSTSLEYHPAAEAPAIPPPAAAPVSAPSAPPAATPAKANPFRALGHFFKRLFVR